MLSDTDGRQWRRNRGDGNNDWGYQPLGSEIHYTIGLEPHDKRWLPALDLPAGATPTTRLVVGYQGGEWNSAGNYLVVRQSDAHAWAEVWLQPGGVDTRRPHRDSGS